MRSLLACLLFLVTAGPAIAKSYTAERFDSLIRVLPGGAIEVTETVVFRFESGTFDHVFREIPTRRTDGIEVVSASMDERPLKFGSGPGEVEIRRQSPMRIRWNFAPRSGTTHTFVLTYRVNGVVKREAGGDVLEWLALPTEHDYSIATSDVVVEAPAPFTARPAFESRRVADASLEPSDRRVQIVARRISKNGWIKTRLHFAEGSVIAAAPAWQQRLLTADALAPQWAMAAGILFAVGLVFVFFLRQGYESPPRDLSSSTAVDSPPDTLRPAVAGALASNGHVALEQAMAALFALADRGVIEIAEEPRSWGQRHFVLHRRGAHGSIAAEEAALLDAAFKHKGHEEQSVRLDKARGRVTKHLGDIKKAVDDQLRSLGLLDDERMRVRSRNLYAAFALLILAGLLVVGAIALTGQYRGWPFLVPGAVALIAVGGFISYGAMTPLSNEGARRAERWRAYQRFLKEVAREKARPTGQTATQLLPFAVALGLAASWSKYVKRHPINAPSWFHAMASTGDGFPAFIAAGGAGDSSGASGSGGGGAAGGGASGAG